MHRFSHTKAAAALIATLCLAATAAPAAQAGTFNTVRFNQPGEWSVGLEPVVTFNGGAGVAAQGRFTIGVTELNNVNVILGMGFGPRLFRFGGNFTFDFFPDVEGQPGIGVAAQGVLNQLPSVWGVDMVAIPYIHKTFVAGKTEIEPFLAIPVGLALYFDGTYRPITSVTLGGIFKATAKLRYIIEFGIGILASDTYLSGGIVFTP